MHLPNPPPLGHPVPDSRHAVSVQLTTWKDMTGMVLGDPRVKKVQQIGYPRSFLQKDVKTVLEACVRAFATSQEACLLFRANEHAEACKTFLCSPSSGDGRLNPTQIVNRAVDFDVESTSSSGSDTSSLDSESTISTSVIRLYAVFFPRESMTLAMVYWRLTGTGISSRLAEDMLEHLDRLHEAPSFKQLPMELQTDKAGTFAMDMICQRIADLLERAPVGPPRSQKVSKSDVFLYPTGMSAIYHCNQLLQKAQRATQSIVFGFPYELTLKLLQTYSKSCKFYGFGTAEELDELEAYLESEADQGRAVQAVWCECASNPLLRTVDLNRIRRLADKFGFAVVVDETIGSFANVDMLGVADIIVTSLTKSFSGYADVMGGSIVLNPSSPLYRPLKSALVPLYRNTLHPPDALTLERNSRDFLPRAATMNATTTSLVSRLARHARSPDSTLRHIYHPSTCWSCANYHAFMRRPTPAFTPGFGGLFTLEFESVAAAAAFFDALGVCKGPSLGASVTLAQPYVQTVFQAEKEWAKGYGLSETIVRISVGLEDAAALGRVFERAVAVADALKEGVGVGWSRLGGKGGGG